MLFDLSASVGATTTSTAPVESSVRLPAPGHLEAAVIRWPATDAALGVRLSTASGEPLFPTPGAEDPGEPEFVEAIDMGGRFPIGVGVDESEELLATFTNPTASAELVLVIVEVAP